MTAPPLADRLDFRLPDFTRHSWTSDAAREVWEPRLRRIGRAWGEVEWRSVADGVRPCNLTRLRPHEIVDRSAQYGRNGLSVLALGLEGASNLAYSSTPAPYEAGHPFVVCAAVGELSHVVSLGDAWHEADHESVGRLLGYPACCREFFRHVWSEQECVDTTWPMARNTGTASTTEQAVDVSGPALANILWRWMAVRAVPHLPCAFDCAPSAELGAQLLNVGRAAGHADEMSWIEEILSWPVEWSALHGIAEVKTPILKVVTRTDATATRYVVRREGTRAPSEAATGLDFPYDVPEHTLVTDSAGFRRGLEHPIELKPKPRPDWYHGDNGFSTRHAMDRAHAPLVELARDALDGQPGGILDLGCGNGALLAKIVAGREGLVPYGIDRDPAAIAHARELHPRHADNFEPGDMFELGVVSSEREYQLVILMVGRLLELSEERRQRLVAALADRCERALLYAYPGYSDERFEDLLARAGFDADVLVPGVAAVASTAQSPAVHRP